MNSQKTFKSLPGFAKRTIQIHTSALREEEGPRGCLWEGQRARRLFCCCLKYWRQRWGSTYSLSLFIHFLPPYLARGEVFKEDTCATTLLLTPQTHTCTDPSTSQEFQLTCFCFRISSLLTWSLKCCFHWFQKNKGFLCTQSIKNKLRETADLGISFKEA